MSETANFESAQALFCAIADKVGSDGSGKIDKVFNLDKDKGYSDYTSWISVPKHKKLVDDVYKSNKLDVDVNRQTIEKFLTKEKSWYVSSVKIAVTLIKTLHTKIDNDFKDIMKPGIQRNYIRGDQAVVGTIDTLFNKANANTIKNKQLMKLEGFGNINKWSPADIYYASKKSKDVLKAELVIAEKKKSYAFPDLNRVISKLINSGDLLPLSLKKVTKETKIVPVNFFPDVRTKMIDGAQTKKGFEGGLWCAIDQKVNTGFDSFEKFPETLGVSDIIKEPAQKGSGIPYEYGEPLNKSEQDKIPSSSFSVSVSDSFSRSNEVGYIQMRHDRSGASWKVDYNPTSSGGRGGSVVSQEMFAKLLEFADPKVAGAFLTAYEKGNAKYKTAKKELEKYKDDIRALNIRRKKDSKKYGISLFQNPKRTSYDYVRGELSSILVTNEVDTILQKWFKKNNIIDKDKTNKVDDFIRILYRYVTSRSETSAKFVIAK